jgi:hypothetical protein
MRETVDQRALGWQNSEHCIIHQDRRWFSLAKNWRQEYQSRLQSGITDPWVNPQTGNAYTNNAQNYRKCNVKVCIWTETQLAEDSRRKPRFM